MSYSTCIILRLDKSPLDFDQLVHACSAARTGSEYQQAFLPITNVRSDQRGGAIIDLQDDDSPEPVSVTITGTDRELAVSWLNDFLISLRGSDAEPPHLPVIRRGGVWVFDTAVAREDEIEEPLSDYYAGQVPDYIRPTRFQISVATSLAESFDCAARSQGRTRQELLLKLIRAVARTIPF